MDNEAIDKMQIKAIQKVLTDWNPLGEYAKRFKDLDNYYAESIDLLFYIDKKSSPALINKLMIEIIEEAFNVNVDPKGSMEYALKIRQIVK